MDYTMLCYRDLSLDSFDEVETLQNSQSILEVDEVSSMTEERINRKYCGSSICRFIFPFIIREQESKAREHLRNIISFAQRTNRVIILPNVGNARLGGCMSFSFDYYYSIESLRRSSPKTVFITQDQFQSWNQEMSEIRARRPTAKVVLLSSQKSEQNQVASEQLDIKRLKKRFCLQPFDYLKYHDEDEQIATALSLMTSRESVWSKSAAWRAQVAQFIIDNLLSVESDVLLLYYNLRYSCLRDLPAPVEYADHLVERAKAAAASLHPYVAIHWRMEKVDSTKLPECSYDLVNYIQQLKKKNGISNVYIATDFPIDGGVLHSGTFRKFTDNHHKAAEILKSNIDFRTWMHFEASLPHLNDTKFLARGKRIPVKNNGSGVLGILDKIILTNADWFVSGPAECSKKTSSYTTQVAAERLAIVRKKSASGFEALKRIQEDPKFQWPFVVHEWGLIDHQELDHIPDDDQRR
ncbi:2129_t:CDS:2 [Paraglomus brasilianum]|uniref:GDP-fucose protein O-fucosyltransferase 2 n=1 Tax=Paraglomus brasilianum TaxID=144538 RepID=A0A9N9CLW8_9GLOM|nr:2129_t:CDS:2 [Paraglomus brasilianum]